MGTPRPFQPRPACFRPPVPMPRLLLIFLDEPLPGQVLPQVEQTVGAKGTVRIYRAMTRVLLRQLSGLQDCRIRICFRPDDAQDAMKFWILPEIIDHPDLRIDPASLDFVPQGPGHRGQRLERAFEAAFAEGFEKVAAIRSDCMEVSSRWINAAFSQLNGRYHGAIGPTPDGHYHLLALREHLPALFRDIPWESGEVLTTTLARAEEQGRAIYQLPPLTNLHTEADYRKALLGPLGPILRKTMKDLEENGW